MRTGRFDEACLYLGEAMKVPADAPRAGKHLAFCLTRTGQYAQAAKVLRKLADAGHMSRSLAGAEAKAVVTLAQARKYARAAQYRDAVQALAAVAQKTYPVTQAHLDAAVALGDAYFAQSQFEQAAAAYARAEASGQKWAYGQAALINHVRSLIECARPGQAVALVEKHTTAPIDPLATDLRRTAADAYLAHADALLAQAGNLSPIGRHVMASKVLAAAYARLVGGANAAPVDEPAQQVAARVRATQTALAKLWLAAGKAALAKHDTARATECFWLAVSNCPHAERRTWVACKKQHNALEREAQARVQQVLRALMAPDQAKTAAQEFKAIGAAYPYTQSGAQAAYYYGKCLRQMGKAKEASAHFKAILDRFPQSDLLPMACYQVGRQLSIEGKQREALRFYRRALKTQPDAPNADMCAFLIAVYYWERKDYKKCAAAAKTLIRNYPNSPLAPRAKAMAGLIAKYATK